jgi:hypothetical protein
VTSKFAFIADYQIYPVVDIDKSNRRGLCGRRTLTRQKVRRYRLRR